MTRLHDLFTTMTDLVLPQWCAGCARRPGQLCTGCATRLTATPQQLSRRPSVGRLPPLWTATSYDGPVRSALLAYKERGRHALATPLGAALARSIAAAITHAGIHQGDVVLVPIPTTNTRRRERGYDPLALLVKRARTSPLAAPDPTGPALAASDPARASPPAAAGSVAASGRAAPVATSRRAAGASTAAAALPTVGAAGAGPVAVVGPPVVGTAGAAGAVSTAAALSAGSVQVTVVGALRHVRRVADQAGLDARARAANLAGALALRHDAWPLLAGRPVVLVDDVLTTGATLAEAARALSAAGVTVCAGAVLAATPRSR